MSKISRSYLGSWFPKLSQTNTCSNLTLKSPILPQLLSFWCLFYNIWIFFLVMTWRVRRMYLFYQVFHPELLYEKSVPKKICKTRRKTSVPGSFLKEDLDLSLATLLFFCVNFAKFLKTLILETSVNGCFWDLCESLFEKFQVFTMKATVLHIFPW